MTFLYCVYGLHLCANQRIPGLIALPTARTSEVQVQLGLMPPWINETQAAEEENLYVSANKDQHGVPTLKTWKLLGGAYFRLRYSDGTVFVVDRQGARIWATWPHDLTLEDTVTYLLGPVLGFVLRLRGIICLHASAIAVGNHVIALLGNAGAGKSTTAAGFAKLGYAVLSDDVVTLTDQGKLFLVQPGYPRLRLWPESVKILYGSADALPRLTPTWDKCYLDLAGIDYRFQRQPLTLTAIYILGERRDDASAPFVDAVSPRTGLITLVGNSYVNYLLDNTMRAQEFEVLDRIVANVPLRRVIPHADPTQLSRLCDTILADFRTLINSSTDDKRLLAR